VAAPSRRSQNLPPILPHHLPPPPSICTPLTCTWGSMPPSYRLESPSDRTRPFLTSRRDRLRIRRASYPVIYFSRSPKNVWGGSDHGQLDSQWRSRIRRSPSHGSWTSRTLRRTQPLRDATLAACSFACFGSSPTLRPAWEPHCPSIATSEAARASRHVTAWCPCTG